MKRTNMENRWLLILSLILATTFTSFSQSSTDVKNDARNYVSRVDSRLNVTEKRTEKQRILLRLTPAALAAGDSVAAQKYAEELLRGGGTSDSHVLKSDSRPIHIANTVLGIIAFRAGNAEKAKQHLLESATFESDRKGLVDPVLASFGPHMDLAKLLLEKGERATVLRFLDLCATFWKRDNGMLDKWRASIKRDETPDLKGHSLEAWRYSN